MISLESARHHLIEHGLLGNQAGSFGSPDELMLVSAGPASYLSEFSLLCGPSSRIVIVRQPSRDDLPSAEKHSPLSGETRIEEGIQFRFQREIWNGEAWEEDRSISDSSLASGMRELCPAGEVSFPRSSPNETPFKNPFWAGALSYDLLQMTQPIRLQNLPEKDDLLCVLWEVNRCIVHHKNENRLIVMSTDSEWKMKSEHCLEDEPLRSFSPELTYGRKPVSNCTDEEHEKIVKTVQQAIVDGQLYQLNYGRSWEGEIHSEPWDVFSHSVTSNPAPYSGFLHMKDEGFALVSASPESLLST